MDHDPSNAAVASLLSVASNCPLANSTRHATPKREVRDINANFRVDGRQWVEFRFDGWWEERELSGDSQPQLLQRGRVVDWKDLDLGSPATPIDRPPPSATSLARG